MQSFKLAPLALVVGALFVASTASAQDFTLDGSSADVTQNITNADTIKSLNVTSSHKGTITGDTITFDGTGLVAQVTTENRPTETDQSILNIGTETTKKVSFKSDTNWALYNKGSSLTVRGEEICIERTSASGANYGEAFRTTGYGETVIGGDETKKVTVKSAADGLVLMHYNGGAESDGKLTVNTDELFIDAGGNGIWAQNNSTGHENHYAPVVINARKGIHITAGDSAIVAMSQGTVELNGNTYIKAKNAILTRGLSEVTINKSGTDIVQIEGDINFNYHEATSKTGVDATVNLNLTGADSYWNGNTTVTWSGKPADPTKLSVHSSTVTLANGAQWTPNEVAVKDDQAEGSMYTALTNLVLNDGVVNLTKASEQQVQIENLKGTGGTINVATTVASDGALKADRTLNVTKSAEQVKLNVVSSNVTSDGITDASKALSGLAQSVTFEQGVGSDVSIQATTQEGDIKGALTQSFDSTGKATSTVKEAVNQKLDGYSSIAALSAVQWRHENDTLLKRMGELRDLEGTVGAWARLYGSEQEYGAQSVKTQNTTIQVGADYDIGQGWKVGGAFSYTDGSSNFDSGNSNNDMYGLAVYGTWLAENGQFVDLIGKYSRLSNEFTSGTMKGDFDNNAFSLAAEAGWHFKLNDLGYVEPSAGLTYGRIMGDTFTAQNGVLVEQEDYDSLIARVGVRSGFYFPNQKGNIYARVAVLHDFMGDMESTASKANAQGKVQTSHLKDGLGDTWVEYGLGANFKLSKTAYTFVDLEKTTGGDVKEAWKWTLGARLAF